MSTKQQNLFPIEHVHFSINRLTREGVDEAALIARGLLNRAETFTYEEIARVKTGLTEQFTLDDMRDLVKQVEAVYNSRGEIADALSDIGVVPVAADGRPAFGAGRSEPVGFSAAAEVKFSAGYTQAKTGMAKVVKQLSYQNTIGRLSETELAAKLVVLKDIVAIVEHKHMDGEHEVRAVTGQPH